MSIDSLKKVFTGLVVAGIMFGVIQGALENDSLA